MNDDRVLKSLRAQAWERAKGELHAMLVTFWDQDHKFQDANKAVEDFVKLVEGDGLQE